MIPTEAEVLAAFPWKGPEPVETKFGPRTKRWCKAGKKTTEYWLVNQMHLTRMGITYREYPLESGIMRFTWWKHVAKDVLEETRSNQELSRQTAVNTDEVIPTPPGLPLDPYQEVAVLFMRNKKRGIFGDSMGLGKTVQALATINKINYDAGKRVIDRILVVCPAGLRQQWASECSRWLVGKFSVGIAEGRSIPTSNVVIVSHSMVARLGALLHNFWDCILIDEAHAFRNPDTLMTRALCGYQPKRNESLLQASTGLPGKWIFSLTGTPGVNRTKDIWPILRKLDPITWNDYGRFAYKYCGGCLLENGWTDAGVSNGKELQDRLRSTLMVRRLKEEVLKDLPPKRRTVMVLPSTGLDTDSFSRLFEDHNLMRWIERLAVAKASLEISRCSETPGAYEAAREALDAAVASGQAVTGELRHKTALAKLPLVIEVLKQAREETPKFLVFAYHRDVLEAIAKEFPGSMLIYGGIDSKIRHAMCEKFQNDPTSGPMIISIPTAVGMHLTAASQEFFVEESWIPGEISQAEDRAHRRGQKDSVLVTHMVLEGSIDQVMCSAVISKQEMLDQVFNIDQSKGEEEMEPVIPVPGVTLLSLQIAQRSLKIKLEDYQLANVAMARLLPQCDPSNRRFHLPDQQIVRQLAQRPITNSKICVLALAVREAYKHLLVGA